MNIGVLARFVWFDGSGITIWWAGPSGPCRQGDRSAESQEPDPLPGFFPGAVPPHAPPPFERPRPTRSIMKDNSMIPTMNGILLPVVGVLVKRLILIVDQFNVSG